MYHIAKVVMLISLSLIVQSGLMLVSALAYNGCSKYVRLESIVFLNTFVWQLWSIGLGATLFLLVFFLSNFFLDVRALARRASVMTFVSLAFYKAFSIALDVQMASECGEARDYFYPYRLQWIPSNLLFFGTVFGWLITVILAAHAMRTGDELPNRQWRSQ